MFQYSLHILLKFYIFDWCVESYWIQSQFYCEIEEQNDVKTRTRILMNYNIKIIK